MRGSEEEIALAAYLHATMQRSTSGGARTSNPADQSYGILISGGGLTYDPTLSGQSGLIRLRIGSPTSVTSIDFKVVGNVPGGQVSPRRLPSEERASCVRGRLRPLWETTHTHEHEVRPAEQGKDGNKAHDPLHGSGYSTWNNAGYFIIATKPFTT